MLHFLTNRNRRYLRLQAFFFRAFNSLEKIKRLTDLQPSSKRPKAEINPTSKSFSEVVKGNRVIAIVNKGVEDSTTARGQWAWIEAKLEDVYEQVLEEMTGSSLSFPSKIPAFPVDADSRHRHVAILQS